MNRWRVVGRLVADHLTPALVGQLVLAAVGGGLAAVVVAAMLGVDDGNGAADGAGRMGPPPGEPRVAARTP